MSLRSSFNSNSSDGPEWNLGNIFGREEESKRLLEISNQTSIQSTVILHGPAGSGKSSLVHSQPWEKRILASGKFQQHGGEPFAALIEALNELVDQWTVLNSVAEVCQMGGFRELLEEDFEFMSNILPKTYQAAMSGCSVWNKKFDLGNERKPVVQPGIGTCVNLSFIRILQFLCNMQPVIFFLDDIHWADRASLDVLKFLASCSSGTKIDNLMLVFSYRDEEVTETHPTMIALNEIKAAIELEEIKGVDIHDIVVANLPVESVNRLVASTTGYDTEATLSLSTVIHQKTAGNAFFVTQFLRMLRQEQFLTYSYTTFKWEWGDLERLTNSAHVSDNVADVIANSLNCLPPTTLVAIKVASCLGKIVPLNVLVEYFKGFEQAQAGHTCTSGLHRIQEGDLGKILDTAVQHGILLKPEHGSALLWAHDKLQHVSYSLIPEEFRASLHIKLGKLLWRMSSTCSDSEWMIFMAAEQLNRFSGDQMLGGEVASLCLRAANLSLSKSALWPAHDMLLAGVKHLGVDDKWITHYDLSLELYSALAELSLQLNKNDVAMAAVKEIQDNVTSLEDKFRSQCVILTYMTSGKDRNYQLGVETSINLLKEYGVKFPNKLYPGQMMIENQKFKRKLPGSKLTSMLDLPDMTDKKSLQIMILLVQYCGMNILLTNQDINLRWYSMIRALTLSADVGICEHTSLAILGWAIHLKDLGQYKEADEFAELALRTMERFPYSVGSLHSRVKVIAVGTVFSVTRQFNKTLDLWINTHDLALRQGESEIASSAVIGYSTVYLMLGLPLDALKTDLVSYELEARQFRLPETVAVLFKILRQVIMNLQDDVANPAVLKGDAIDEDETLNSLEGPGYQMTKRDLYTHRLLLACIFGSWEIAEMLLEELEPFGSTDISPSRGLLRKSTRALAAFKLSRKNGKKTKKYRNIGKTILKEVEKDVKNGNVNSYPFYLMLQAEESPSKEKYDQSIRAFARLGFLNYEAYMCEQAGKFFLEKNDVGWGEFYMGHALVLYEEWGARGKANRMKEAHSELLKSSDLNQKASSSLKGRTRYSSEHTDQLKTFHWNRLGSSISGENGSSSLGIPSDGDTKSDHRSDTTSEGRGIPSSFPLSSFTL